MTRLVALFIVLVFSIHSPLASAANDAKKAPELTKEERLKRADMMDKMAEVHKKMAECLRSDKPMTECREMMQKECPMAKEGHCPMMEEMKMGGMHGHRHGMMMKEEKKETEKKD